MSLLQISITSGVVVAVTALLRLVALNKIPKVIFLVLWAVALLRLLMPFSLEFAVPTPTPIPMPVLNDAVAFAGAYAMPTANAPVDVGAVVWLAGVAVAAVFFAVIYFRVSINLRDAVYVRGNEFLNEWLEDNRIWRHVAIMQSDRIVTPIAVGLLRPRIILPKGMDLSDRELLSHVLAHELTHIRRLDALWKLLLVFALCVHWFNPLVWLLFVLANRDLELTCDEAVVRRLGRENRAAYAFSIINMAEKRSRLALLYNGFSKNAIRERTEMIMKFKKSSVFSLAAAMTLVFVLASGAFVNLSAAMPEELFGQDQEASVEVELVWETRFVPGQGRGFNQVQMGRGFNEFCLHPDCRAGDFCRYPDCRFELGGARGACRELEPGQNGRRGGGPMRNFRQ